MLMDIEKVRYQRSPPQAAHELKKSLAWGGFVRYIELGDDGFASRQVDEYHNGYFARYDRDHWEDQFGTLADARYGARGSPIGENRTSSAARSSSTSGMRLPLLPLFR
jgi:hypothetical protein